MTRVRGSKCHPEIYSQGEVVDILAISKIEADAMCDQGEAMEPDYLYDWNFAAGRAVIRRLKKSKMQTPDVAKALGNMC